MWITIIILAYVANVFLNRWLNKIDYKYNNAAILPAFWFTSLICTIVITVSIIVDFSRKRKNWFTGKYW